MTNKMAGISVIIPCLNEESSIAQTISGLSEVLPSLGVKYEIIVVNDASKDNTPKLLAKFENIAVLTNDSVTGYGGSIKRGLLRSNHEMVLIIDADGTYPCKSIPKLFSAAIENDYDMVVGARTKMNNGFLELGELQNIF